MFGIPWHKLPVPLGLLKVVGFRTELRKHNLHDTSQLPDKDKLAHPPAPSPDDHHLVSRTADGSYNDLDHPEMGMAKTRFGRNIPLEDAKLDESKLLSPSPRLISSKLLARQEFKPATILSLLAAAWIQFETHDWFSHGNNQPDNKIDVPIPSGDDWEQQFHQPLRIDKTLEDTTRTGDTKHPPSFINYETHWWDASQIYGSSQERIDQVRTHVDGKLNLGEDGLIPIDPTTGTELVGNPGTWWLGIGLLHTLFVKEHNLICDYLKEQYSQWTDDELFDHARLIVAALTAKIHTVEWTPAILPHPVTKMALHANWWGILGPDFKRMFGRVGDSEILSGIVGSSMAHHDAAPYYLTEEFTSVYRMHPLVRDEYEFYSVKDGRLIRKTNFLEIFEKQARQIMETISMADLFYSFGIMNPGSLTLHNYPQFLRGLVKNNETFDLASVDILRDRERGVPRYNLFRELLGRGRVKSFEEITSNPQWAKELREIYNNDVDSVDLMVGLYSEDLPEGFGFSDTAFRVFILMASRRLRSDRFFTKDYRSEVYTQWGLDWIEKTTMTNLLLRHYPDLARSLWGVENAFAPWRKVGATA
ncbi:MAG: peroxidase [Stigonema ocellatum SAG 48.90 = DSM 106950]|nr:peroxidase [Stigonema ocellatum SAG 48.90 = DSM 106950]